MVFGAITLSAAAFLNVLDFVLVLFCHASGFVRRRFIAAPTKRPSVVIVGASFAGLHAQRMLSDDFDVTVVDLKDYFEYTPGVLRLFVEPDHLRNLAKPLPTKRCKVVVGEVTFIDEHSLTLRSGETLSFDYLVLATGSKYPAINAQNVVKPGAEQPSLASRAACWEAAAASLAKAESALVIGGGPVGVELAAEIASVYPHKRVTLVSRSERLCTALPDAVGTACLRWLERRNVEVLRGVSVATVRDDGATLSNGRELSADAVYNCAGALPNTAWLDRTPLGRHVDSQSGRVLVNDFLSVEGLPHIFAVGDAMLHRRSADLKLGHTAELNAAVAAENILRLHRADQANAKANANAKAEAAPEAAAADLARYPEFTTFGAAQQAQVFCVSLGKHSAVMAFNGIVLSGGLPALVKWALEWTKVAACEERPVGTLFWHVADTMTALITRTVLPPPQRIAAAA